jgi:hypothetical protein
MNRIRHVMRLQIPAWPHVVGWPWGMVACSFAINLVTFAAIGGRPDGAVATGGVAALYGVAAGMAAVSVTQIFPYALGMSVTRGEFYLAWSLLAVAQSVAYALVLYLLHAVERATDGWGVAMLFFGPPFVATSNPLLQILVYAVPMLLVTFFGIAFGAVHLRWGTPGVFAAMALAILGFGLLVALITWTERWSAIVHWLLHQAPATLLAGWSMLGVAALACAGYTLIRRVTA